MRTIQMRPQYQFVRCTRSWRFWAFGYAFRRAKIDVYSYRLLVVGFGPLRFTFIDTASRWKPLVIPNPQGTGAGQ